MQLIALALAPGIAICLYLFYKDVYNKEPRLNLFVSFLLGGLAILPAIGFEKSFASVIDGSLMGVAVFSYAVVAFSEEGSKFLGLRLYAYNQKCFDEPFDGIVYSVMVSMGFATVENIKYVVFDTQSLNVAFLRMFLSVPAHATFAVVMGYFVGKAKANPSKSAVLMSLGLLGSIFFHGSFDFLLFVKQMSYVGQNASEILLFAGAVLSFIIAVILSRRMMKAQLVISKQMFKEENITTTTGV
jgi:RsiW-degrading membrane proteinase PrsW (M82 family)